MADHRVIVITGCSTGIGAHCARALKADGWRVFATVRQTSDLAGLEADGIEALIMDYTDSRTITALVETVSARTGGRIDALFNNGAYGQPGAVEDLSTDILRLQFETNFFGWHELTRQIIPLMRRRGQGRIVQCSSILGLIPYRYRGAYTASKFALEGLSISLRMELQGSGIHVSLIEPGPIASRFTATALAQFQANIDIEGSAHAAEYRRQLARLNGTGPVNRHKRGPEAVYSVLKHALEARRPHPHYLVTTPAKQGAWLKRLLPADLFYRLMRRSIERGGFKSMSTVTTVLAVIFMGLVAIVLVRGLFNMTRGNNPSLSNRLMQMRILLQAIAIILIMLTLWLTGGGRPG